MRRFQNGPKTILALLAALLMALACGGDGDTASKPGSKPAPKPQTSTPKPTLPTDPAELAELGRSVYMSNCIACHNPDPAQDGALGPPVMGSSEELLRARVIHGTYPEGYTPKRDTKVMVPLNFLEPQIPALAGYLGKTG